MSESKEFTVSEVIDSFGINGHTWLMFILLGLANIFDGYDFMVVNSTNTYLAASFGLIDWSTGAAVVNSAALGSLTTWGLLGMVLGGACGGIMSDKLGRKKMLIIACFFYGIKYEYSHCCSNIAIMFILHWQHIVCFSNKIDNFIFHALNRYFCSLPVQSILGSIFH